MPANEAVAAGPIRRSNQKRTALLFWVAIAAAVISLLTVASIDSGGVETDNERIARLANSFACPICNGESVSESNAAVSVTIRKFISDEVATGSTDTEIRDSLVSSYGVEVLLNPPAEGLSTLLWVLPVMLVVLGTVGVAAAVSRGRQATRDPSSRDRELVAALLSSEDTSEQLDGADSGTTDSDGADSDGVDRADADSDGADGG